MTPRGSDSRHLPRRPEFKPVAAGFAIYDGNNVWGIGKTIAEAASDAENYIEGNPPVLTIRPCTEALIHSVRKGHADQWFEVDGIIVAFYEVPEEWVMRVGRELQLHPAHA